MIVDEKIIPSDAICENCAVKSAVWEKNLLVRQKIPQLQVNFIRAIASNRNGKEIGLEMSERLFPTNFRETFSILISQESAKSQDLPKKKSFKWKRGRILLLPLFGRKPLIEHFLSERPKSSECRKLLSLSSFSLFFVGPGRPGPHQSDLIF